MWDPPTAFAYHADIRYFADADANRRGCLALSCCFARYPGVFLCSRGVLVMCHLAQPKIITRIARWTRDFRYIQKTNLHMELRRRTSSQNIRPGPWTTAPFAAVSKCTGEAHTISLLVHEMSFLQDGQILIYNSKHRKI